MGKYRVKYKDQYTKKGDVITWDTDDLEYFKLNLKCIHDTKEYEYISAEEWNGTCYVPFGDGAFTKSEF